MPRTYFERKANGDPLEKLGYSSDKRSDCKQVGIALVVSRRGMPINYEVFAGNRRDVTTVEEIGTTRAKRVGHSD